MSTTESFSEASPKSLFRIGYILVILLLWQVSQSPLMGRLGANVQNFPQVVINAGSTTSFTLYNPSEVETIRVDVLLWGAEGNEMDSRQVELGPWATEAVSFAGDSNADLMRGWAELRSEHEFVATEFFQLFVGGLKPRVGVLPCPPGQEIRFAGFVDQTVRSGLAVHNPSPTQDAAITVRLRDHGGQQPVSEKTLTLKPRQSMAGFLNEDRFFGPALSSFEGTVEISGRSSPVAALSLIQESSGDVATVAVEVSTPIITGTSNTAIGQGALVSNTTGEGNTAGGVRALQSNTSGNNNTASGFYALLHNTIGARNTASGLRALVSNTTGSDNTATGSLALVHNTTGYYNTGIGAKTLMGNTTGTRNTAAGESALYANTTGKNNTATGVNALLHNMTGTGNTATGYNALFANTTGNDNIAIGYGAGSDLLTGDNNIYIGDPGESEESNTIRIGNSGHTAAFVAGVQLVPLSSRRFKQDIHDMGRASSDLMRLRPVTFRYKKAYDSGEGCLQYGLIAEEVAEVYPELVVDDDTGKVKTVEYQKLPAMLLNELQKQQAIISKLTERLSRLEQVLSLPSATSTYGSPSPTNLQSNGEQVVAP